MNCGKFMGTHEEVTSKDSHGETWSHSVLVEHRCVLAKDSEHESHICYGCGLRWKGHSDIQP